MTDADDHTEVPGQLSSAEAARRLGIKPATLYAYVSRGLLSRTRTASGSRFDATEVERLAGGSRRAGVSPTSPFVTELSAVEAGAFSYRGLDAVELSRTRSFEEVATWLWEGQWPSEPSPWLAPAQALDVASRACTTLDPRCTPAERWAVALAAAAASDPLRYDRAPTSVMATARGILALLVETLPELGTPSESEGRGAPLAARLWQRLSPLPAAEPRLAALDAALVLLADHEMSAPTIAARMAAAGGADPYAVVLAGVAAASGPLHATSSLQVRPVLARAEAQGPAVALGEVLGRDGVVHGFGHPLHPEGDPRAEEILGRLHHLPASLDVVDAVLSLAATREMPAPNCDFALAALAQTSLMTPGASEAIFLLARAAGWVGHALEEYDQASLRPARSAYPMRR